MRNVLLFFSCVMLINSLAFANGVYAIDPKKGYAVDGTGQLPISQRIAPPNKVDITPYYSETIVPFEKYIKNSGTQRYSNVQYSERRAVPYSKQQYIDTWCTGEKNVKGVDCMKGDYAITFVRARNWAGGSMKAIYKAKRAHKKPVLFLMVDDICLDGSYMQEAKAWAELWNSVVVFGTIDSFIPWSYVAS